MFDNNSRSWYGRAGSGAVSRGKVRYGKPNNKNDISVPFGHSQGKVALGMVSPGWVRFGKARRGKTSNESNISVSRGQARLGLFAARQRDARSGKARLGKLNEEVKICLEK